MPTRSLQRKPTKAVAALLRDASSLLRRTDKLAQAAEARQVIEQLVHHVAYLEEQYKRQARDAGRRGR